MSPLNDLFTEARGAQPLVSGKWFEIRLTPDLITDERLNIGVGFVPSRGGNFEFRLLESASVFTCLYGKQAKEQFDFLLKTTKSALNSNGPSTKISPHITFGKPRFAQGYSVKEIIDHLYQSTVTLARRTSEPEEAKQTFISLDNADVCNIVFSSMRSKNVIEANRLISGGDYPLNVESDDGPHELRFTLRNEMRIAHIASAWYRRPDSATANLKGSLLDLSVAAHAFPQIGGALFILKPNTVALPSEEDQRAIDNVIDMAEWRAKKLKILFRSEMEPDPLADHILDWGATLSRTGQG